MSAPHLAQYRFQKGQTGNPGGRTKIPEHLKAIRGLTAGEVAKLISKYARMTCEELAECLENDSQMAVIDRCFIGMFEQSIRKNDYTALNFLLDRAIGKAPIYIEGEEEKDDSISKMPTHELLQLIRNAIPDNKKASE